jgi:hypothetical protein
MKNIAKRERSPVMVKMTDIAILPEFQVRHVIDEDVVAEYSQHLDDGGELDPIHIFENDLPVNGDGGKQPPNYLAEGFHRYKAHEKSGRTKIPAFIHTGESFQALELAIQTNCHHGHPMDRQSKYKAVKMALENTQLRRRSNKALAQLCGVSPTFVQRMREGKIRVDGAGPRKRAVRAPKEPVTTAGDPGAHEQTDVEAADERMDQLHDWLKTGLADPPMILNTLNRSKKYKFIGLFPKVNPTVVVMQGGTFLREVTIQDITVREGKIEITVAEGEEAPV